MNRFHAFWEQVYPYLLGALAGALSLSYGVDAGAWLAGRGVELKELFATVFDIASVMTPFLFAFFGIVVAAPSGSFISGLSGTRVFRLFLRYVGEAMALGTGLTLLSVPFKISGPTYDFSAFGTSLLLAAWVFFGVAAFFGFFRVTQVFLIWILASSRSRRNSSFFSPAE